MSSAAEVLYCTNTILSYFLHHKKGFDLYLLMLLNLKKDLCINISLN
jgi:hypothetical protein